jgi:16S rRNA (guanine966-N2)-methyltransferase
VAPPGTATRPTSDRLRQALFDLLWHAPWAGREAVEGAVVLDAFAGTGALGLEAISRGAANATFLERDHAALAALRRNIATCGAEAASRVLAIDATRPPPSGAPASLVFLDPPYRQNLVPVAVTALTSAGWLAPNALLVAETARDEPLPLPLPCLDDRTHGAARISVWRFAPGSPNARAPPQNP